MKTEIMLFLGGDKKLFEKHFVIFVIAKGIGRLLGDFWM